MKFPKLFPLLLCAAIFSFTACSPKITTKVATGRAPLSAHHPVAVLGQYDEVPESAEELGTVKIGDSGFSTNCTYEKVMTRAKEEARASGGNALKITEHKPPTAMGSSCHRITASILHIPDELLAGLLQSETPPVDSALLAEGCAVIHIYRFGGAGAAVGFDIHVGDEVIARARNNDKESVKILARGETTFWAKTEASDEVTFDVQPGNHYYLRCSIQMGVMVGRPVLERVDWRTGEVEFQTIKAK